MRPAVIESCDIPQMQASSQDGNDEIMGTFFSGNAWFAVVLAWKGIPVVWCGLREREVDRNGFVSGLESASVGFPVAVVN